MSADTTRRSKDRLWHEAAVLVVRSRNGTPADAKTLRAWVDGDPERLAVVSKIEASWSLAGRLRDAPQIAEMRTASARFLEHGQSQWRGVRWGAAAAACAAFGVVVSVAMSNLPVASSPILVAESRDHPRVIRLDDGSTVTLDARSRLEVRFSTDKREIKLTQGQARFAVAHDAAWPFHVVAANRDVRAVGTDFIVNARDGAVAVSLLQGSVSVSRIVIDERWLGLSHTPALVEPMRLLPGQQLRVMSGHRPTLARFSLDDVTAWQQGRLHLNDLRLADAVAAVNRYADVKVRLDRSVPDGLRISGSLRSGDSDAFASNIVMLYPSLSLTRENKEIIIGQKQLKKLAPR